MLVFLKDDYLSGGNLTVFVVTQENQKNAELAEVRSEGKQWPDTHHSLIIFSLIHLNRSLLLWPCRSCRHWKSKHLHSYTKLKYKCFSDFGPRCNNACFIFLDLRSPLSITNSPDTDSHHSYKTTSFRDGEDKIVLSLRGQINPELSRERWKSSKKRRQG